MDYDQETSFSGSLPATRLAIMDFDPIFLTVSRAAIAEILLVYSFSYSSKRFLSEEILSHSFL
jgi:hypothetical protein